MHDIHNKYLVLAYEEDSPEFVCVGTYETQIQASIVVEDIKYLFKNKRLIIAEILKDVYNA